MQSILTEKKSDTASKSIASQNTGNGGSKMAAVPALQKKEVPEEELPVQCKFTIQQKSEPLQKAGLPEEDLLQKKPFQLKKDTVQRASTPEKELPVQGKFQHIQKKENKTGLPDNLKSGVESLSGFSMDDVKVHYNSSQPAQLNALAYAQGTDIHVAPGQEQHLPHEAWHVAQQKQGRVQPTIQMKAGVAVNDDPGLENEADVMGAKALNLHGDMSAQLMSDSLIHSGFVSGDAIQRMALPLDDLQNLGHKSKDFSEEDAKSARIMTEAVSNRVHATGESVARPHQVIAKNKACGLAKIGLTEELRIFGHGQTTRLSGDVAVQIAGYTPATLAQLLINMGLPVNYQGEIYLSGCLTAVGPNHGFLGSFYQIIKDHCGGCRVRGNLGNSTTFPDGTQGFWWYSH